MLSGITQYVKLLLMFFFPSAQHMLFLSSWQKSENKDFPPYVFPRWKMKKLELYLDYDLSTTITCYFLPPLLVVLPED